MDTGIRVPRGVALRGGCAWLLLGVLVLVQGCGGPEAPSVDVDAMLRALASDDAGARAKAAHALAGPFTAAARAAPVLHAALQDDAADVRVEAARSLDALGRAAVGPFTRFLGAASDPERQGLVRALDQIRMLGARVTAMDLARADGVRGRCVLLASESLLRGDDPPGSGSTPYMVDAVLAHEAQRGEAVAAASLVLHQQLIHSSPKSMPDPAGLAALASDPEESIRWLAAGLCGSFEGRAPARVWGAPASGPADPALVDELLDRVPRRIPRGVALDREQIDAVRRLGRLGHAAAAAKEQLESLMPSVLECEEARAQGQHVELAVALGRVDRPTGDVAGLLVGVVAEAAASDAPDMDGLWRACVELTRFVPDMPSKKMRHQIAARVAPAAARFGLGGSPGEQLLQLLEALGPDAGPASGTLAASLEGAAGAFVEAADPAQRLVAEGHTYESAVALPHRLVRLLTRLGPEGKAALPALEKLAGTEDPLLRYEVALARRVLGR